MNSIDRRTGHPRRTLAVSLIAVAFAALTTRALAENTVQLTVPAPEYTLGRFKYQAPKTDGWRQLSDIRDGLSMVYAEQKTEDTIETRFGVVMEVHEIPENVQVEGAPALADLSRKQMVEARKADLVGQSAIEAVPSIDNMYTYRLLVRSPVKDMPDAYEIYYVAMAPDKSQYVVIQCITKTPDYANDLYFTEFYGSLASLKYVPAAGDGKAASSGSTSPGKPGGEAAKAAGEAATPAGAAAPAAAGH